MTSRARRGTLEVTVPPLEEAWKNWLSSNSHACAAWARNTVSTLAYWRRMPCRAKKKNCLARRRCASSMLPETSSAKITAALVAGKGRFTSWRKRRSSLTSEIGSSSTASPSPGSPRPWPAPCWVLASAGRSRACSRNLTGTATVRLPLPVMRSPLDRSSGSVSLTASRTFSLCRSQSLAPLEKRSYQGVSAAMRIVTSFLGEQRGDVIQRFAGAVRVVAILVHQALLHHGDLLPGLVIRTGGRADQPQHV